MSTSASPMREPAHGAGRRGGRINSARLLLGRELNLPARGHFSAAERRDMFNRFLPRGPPAEVDSMASRGYIGQFSRDGDLFIAGFQDRRIRLYECENDWRLRKDVLARNLRWTITDTTLSPDQRFLAYSSITPIIHMVNVGRQGEAVESIQNVTDIHEALNFGLMSGGHERQFGIWSVSFSGDGREMVAGASDTAMYIYDLETQRTVLRVRGHNDDVNAVAFADDTSNTILTGSDDNNIKLWDRRSLSSGNNRPAGVLIGHTQGLTHIDARGDGRYLISNSKDQTLKLWDLRKMCSQQEAVNITRTTRLPNLNWDYRWMEYPATGVAITHPNDCSIATYRGHRVLQTLIRCYFSPAHSTGQRYIYTGSQDGSVWFYDLVTCEPVARVRHHRVTVRDVSWHPWLPMCASISWDGTLVKWEHDETGAARYASDTSCAERV